MSAPNRSSTSPPPFLLMGVPDLEVFHVWISIPFCVTYIVALLGNTLVLLAVGLDRSLHEPMYCFIAMLALIDLIFSTAVAPKMLGVFWLGSRETGFEACFLQMFFIHTFTTVESGVLLAMSLDRYVAMCHPLRCSTILTGPRAIHAGLLSLARGVGMVIPLMWLLISLPYCSSRLIPHSYCEHRAVVGLACADTATSHRYSLGAATLLVGTDSAFITSSYCAILRAVLWPPSHTARLKALGTCGSHIFVILIFYTGGLLSVYLQMFTHSLAPHARVLVGDSYLTVPPMLNPLVYGMRVKQIQEGIHKLLGQLAGPRSSQAARGGSGSVRQTKISPMPEQV